MATKAVVLLSGGLDSATVLGIYKDAGWSVYALSVLYGQRHGVELGAARRVAKEMGVVEHVVANLADLGGVFKDSAITTPGIEPRKDAKMDEIGKGIPETFVPGRNLLLLSVGVAYAARVGAAYLGVGANAVDYSGYPDCRPEFFYAFNTAARRALGDSCNVETCAPLLHLSKAQIVRRGLELGVPYEMTHTCYDSNALTCAACGECDACLLRLAGFKANGVADPIRYEDSIRDKQDG